MPKQEGTTYWVQLFASKDEQALSHLMNRLYPELKKIAVNYMRQERQGHTLQPSALVNEAFLRMIAAKAISLKDRAHFFAVASMMMRRVLVDHARGKNAKKRCEPKNISIFNESVHSPLFSDESNREVLVLNQVLEELEKDNPRRAKVVEMKYFAGLTIEQIAFSLDCSVNTVKREWAKARAWIYQRMEG